MTMTNADIVREYRTAKSPLKQIGVLADLNCCTKHEIVDVLVAAGEEIPKQYQKRKAPEKIGGGAVEAPRSEPFAAATTPDSCVCLSLAQLQQMLPSGVIIERVEEITVSGKPVRSVNLVCAYDVATGKTKWTLDLCGE